MVVREVNGSFDLRHGAAPRSPGVHVSEVIKELALNMGCWKREDQDELDFTLARYHADRGDNIVKMYPTAIYRIAMGLAWESWYGPQQGIHFHEIGERKKDGIIGTPDGHKFNSQAGRVQELKLTWKSSRDELEDPQERFRTEYPWTSQGCSYCYLMTIGEVKWWTQNGVVMASSNLVTGCDFHVFWVNGNYKGSGPQPKVYEIDFTPEEVLGNWKVIKAKSLAMEAERGVKDQH